MADEKTADSIIATKCPNAKPAKRITEEQFRQAASEWLGQAKSGQQVIVVDNAISGRITMVLGVNGVNFQLPKDEEPSSDADSWIK